MKTYIGYNKELIKMIAGFDGYDRMISCKKTRHGSYEIKFSKSVDD